MPWQGPRCLHPSQQRSPAEHRHSLVVLSSTHLDVLIEFLLLRVKSKAPSITSTDTAIGAAIPVDSATAEDDEEALEVVELDDTAVVSLVVVLVVVEEEVVEVLVVEVVELVLPPTTVSPVAFTSEGV